MSAARPTPTRRTLLPVSWPAYRSSLRFCCCASDGERRWRVRDDGAEEGQLGRRKLVRQPRRPVPGQASRDRGRSWHLRSGVGGGGGWEERAWDGGRAARLGLGWSWGGSGCGLKLWRGKTEWPIHQPRPLRAPGPGLGLSTLRGTPPPTAPTLQSTTLARQPAYPPRQRGTMSQSDPYVPIERSSQHIVAGYPLAAGLSSVSDGQ